MTVNSWQQANNILSLRMWMFSDSSPLSSGPQNPAAQHHGQRSAHQQLRGDGALLSPSLWDSCGWTAVVLQSETQVSLHCISCPQLVVWYGDSFVPWGPDLPLLPHKWTKLWLGWAGLVNLRRWHLETSFTLPHTFHRQNLRNQHTVKICPQLFSWTLTVI